MTVAQLMVRNHLSYAAAVKKLKDMSTPEPSPNQIQTVILTLDDGSKHAFAGKVAIREGDAGRKIVDIKFTEPRDLPAGMSWEEAK
jgi:hypothetical protein